MIVGPTYYHSPPPIILPLLPQLLVLLAHGAVILDALVESFFLWVAWGRGDGQEEGWAVFRLDVDPVPAALVGVVVVFAHFGVGCNGWGYSKVEKVNVNGRGEEVWNG